MKELRTEIEIEATAQSVWQVLTDFERYSEWNPFFTSIAGEPHEGSRLTAKAGAMTFRPVVLRAEADTELRWLGHLGLPGLFDGEHRFEIEPMGERRVRFRQSERFSELLVPIVWLLIGSSTRRGFEAMNAALKTRAEAGD